MTWFVVSVALAGFGLGFVVGFVPTFVLYLQASNHLDEAVQLLNLPGRPRSEPEPELWN